MKQIKIYSEHIDEEALEQFHSAMEQDFSLQGALMPDAHKGYSLPIGAVVATKGVILPSWVGYDIGCGMCAYKTTFSKKEILTHKDKIFDKIYREIPVGFAHQKEDQVWDFSHLKHSSFLRQVIKEKVLRQLGTLGGGNHFMEIGYDEKDEIWIVIHSGSRGVGHITATHYMKLASNSNKAREGHFGFDVTSRNGKDYINDMNFCLEFALENRKQMIQKVVEIINCFVSEKPYEFSWKNLINRNHNHAELKNKLWIHRKGATHAESGMMGIIPGNMRDGSFIVKGKGNKDSLSSSSHGAGRVLGRRKAKDTFSMDSFKREMKGIKARVQKDTLDESPQVYKNIFEVMELQRELVEVQNHIKPIINIKG